jgi:hypothetical protein
MAVWLSVCDCSFGRLAVRRFGHFCFVGRSPLAVFSSQFISFAVKLCISVVSVQVRKSMQG